MSTTSPVSVVVPCYNASAFVARAVASAVAERPREVVLVDDGSADDTLAVLHGLAQAHPGVVRVVAQANGGAPSARNAGLRASAGAWVQFLDADDALRPGKLARQVALAEATRADLVAGAAQAERPDGTFAPRDIGTDRPWVDLATHRLGITSANLFRRSAVEAVGGWDERLPCSQEYDLMFRMLQAGAAVAYDPEPGAEIGYREGSVGRSDRAFAVSLDLRARLLAHDRAHGVLSAADRREVLDFLFRWIRIRYSRSPAEARAAHRAVIPRGFVPTADGVTTPLYVRAYRLLGLAGAERVRRLLGR